MNSSISPKAKIGKNVQIGAFTTIGDNVEIGDDSVIGSYCYIGHPAGGEWAGKTLKIGKGAIIRSHTIMYEGSEFGERLRVGHSSMIREATKAGVNFQIGSFNDIEGHCEVGDYVRFHSNVHIGQCSKVGNFVWIFPYVVLTNDPLPPSGLAAGVVVEDGATICTSSVVLPGTHVGRGVFIGALSRAKGNIPAGAIVLGGDGKIVGSLKKLKHKESGKNHPWMSHFVDYYPPESRERIEELHQQILGDLKDLDVWLAEREKKAG